jgi:hypothetical protein
MLVPRALPDQSDAAVATDPCSWWSSDHHEGRIIVKKTTKVYAGAGGALMLASLALAGGLANANAADTSSKQASGVHLHAHLNPLNNSGARGNSDVVFHGHRAHVDVDAYRLARNLPHAEHIHFGAEARHECPSVFDDRNGDFRLNTTDGLPAYGPIRKSLTTRGDTSPDSALAVTRFPTAPKGAIHYDRRINFSSAAVARAIRTGKGVIVIHGIDYNNNGKYDFKSAGRSDLDRRLPAEATDPALCGVLR